MFPYRTIVVSTKEVFGEMHNGVREHIAWCAHRTAALLVGKSIADRAGIQMIEESL